MTDKDIIQKFISGDTESFLTVRSWIQDVVTTMTWSGGISRDDVLGDTLEKLLLIFRANQFNFQSTLKTYIQRITRYTIVDSARRNRRAQAYSLSVAQQPSVLGDDPSTIFEVHEQTEIYARILSLVNEHCRQIWEMIFGQRMHYVEIGKRLGITENTVKVRVHRCKEEAVAIRRKLV